MTASVEFYFDYLSPMSYFGFHRLKALRERTGCDVVMRPMSLQGVMEATGNRPPGLVANKGKFYALDFQRHAKRFGLPFQVNPAFPMNTIRSRRLTAGLLDADQLLPVMGWIFHNTWAEPKDISDKSVLYDVLKDGGFDAEALFELSNLQSNKDLIRKNTKIAVSRGVFGAPTFFVGDDMYFGQDRLDFVEDALTERAWV